MKFSYINRKHNRSKSTSKMSTSSDFACRVCGKSCETKRGVVLHQQRKHPTPATNDSDDEVPLQQKAWTIVIVELDGGGNFVFTCNLCHFMCLEKKNLIDHLKETH